MSDREKTPKIVALPSASDTSYPPDIVERAYEIYVGAANYSAPATVHLLGLEYAGGPIPAVSTIRKWATEYNWRQRDFSELRENFGLELVDMRRRWFGHLRRADEIMSEIMAGMYADNVAHGILQLKAAELIIKRSGVGTFGANQGGFMSFQLESLDANSVLKDESISVDTRLRMMREMIAEENSGMG